MKYLILAEICLTIGAPNWVVVFCWVCFGLNVTNAIVDMLIKICEKFKEKN